MTPTVESKRTLDDFCALGEVRSLCWSPTIDIQDMYTLGFLYFPRYHKVHRPLLDDPDGRE